MQVQMAAKAATPDVAALYQIKLFMLLMCIQPNLETRFGTAKIRVALTH